MSDERLKAFCQDAMERLEPIRRGPNDLNEPITLMLTSDEYLRLLGLIRWCEHEIGCIDDATPQPV